MYAKGVRKDRIPLGRTDVEQKRPGSVGHFANVLTCAHANRQILYSLSMTGALAGWLKTDARNQRLDATSLASHALRTSSQLSIIHLSLIAEKHIKGGREVLHHICQINQRYCRRLDSTEVLNSTFRPSESALSALLRT